MSRRLDDARAAVDYLLDEDKDKGGDLLLTTIAFAGVTVQLAIAEELHELNRQIKRRPIS